MQEEPENRNGALRAAPRDQQPAAVNRLQHTPARDGRPGAGKATSQRRVSKSLVNFAVDTVLLVLVVTLLFLAAMLRFVFPAPSLSAGWTLWGFGYDAWSNLEFGLVAVFGLSILLHVMLHWSWVCGVVVTQLLRKAGATAKLDEGQQTLWGVGLLILVVNIIGLLLGAAYLSVQGPAN